MFDCRALSDHPFFQGAHHQLMAMLVLVEAMIDDESRLMK
jgi:hypothetical protein